MAFTDEDREKLSQVHTWASDLRTSHADHEIRLRSVEKFRTQAVAIIAVISSSFGYVISYLKGGS